MHVSDLRLALAAALDAGALVLPHFRTDPHVTHKSPDQPVTAADLSADALLRERLLGGRPDHGWLSEETADSPDRLERRRVWIVDPIDGTRSFIAGRREFVVSIGVCEAGEAVLGVLLNPASGELFWATRGGGAFLSRALDDVDSAFAAAEALRVVEPDPGQRPRLLASRSELSRGEFEAFPDAEWHIHRLGSTAYKLAGVACGIGDAFLSRGPKSEWDVIAGCLIVEEAGGLATDLAGRPPSYNKPRPTVHGALAAAPRLHARLLAEVARLPPTERMLSERPEED